MVDIGMARIAPREFRITIFEVFDLIGGHSLLITIESSEAR
jgi:hypothetical protein